MYVTRSFLGTPDFAPCMAQVLDRVERFAGICLAAQYLIADIGKDIVDNHRTEPGDSISPDQGGVRGASLLCGGWDIVKKWIAQCLCKQELGVKYLICALKRIYSTQMIIELMVTIKKNSRIIIHKFKNVRIIINN